MSNNTFEAGYQALTRYVRLNNFGNTFDGNSIRKRLSQVRGLRPAQYGSVVSKGITNGLLVKLGETSSNDPLHNGRRVGIYTRGYGVS